MDKKDHILLYELGKDARASFAQLAKATRISQETVRYRINRLIEEGIIKKFMIYSNTRLLGYSFYQMFLKLQNASEKDRQEIVNYLKNEPHMAWVADFEGKFDIGFIVMVKDQTHLQGIVERIYSEFGQKIMQKALSFQLSAEFFPRDYLVNNKRHTDKTEIYKPIKEKINIDSKDLKICAILSEEGRKSMVDISSAVNLSADATAKRVKHLEKTGLITGYGIDLAEEKIGLMHYKVLLRLNMLSQSQTNALLAQIRSYTRTTALIQMLADWDYEVDVEVENTSQIREFIMSLTSDSSGIIKDYDLLRIEKVHRYNFFPNIG